MSNYLVPEFSPGVFGVGIRDWSRRIFDALVPLPHGTTYNSYLIKGSDKIAVIDTANPGFEEEWASKIATVTPLESIDYVIMNHAEPDHSGAIPYILERNAKAVLVTSEKGKGMAQVYYKIPDERIRLVGESDTIDLGGKTLRFINAPWLHWPETMFTYLVENKVLFPCDFFGAHTASLLLDGEFGEVYPAAKRYYGEIMMPFRKKGEEAMKKLEAFDIAIIAPSHGPIHENPVPILEAYKKWTAGQTRQKAVIAYVTMWGSTEKMIQTLTETLLARGVEVSLHNLINADLGELAGDLVDARAIVLGAPTVLGGMHPLGIYAASLVRALRPPAKYAAVLSSYGWGKGAIKNAAEILEPLRLEVVGAVETHGPASEDEVRKVVELADAMAAKILAEP
jgi:flavorubredoxin